MNVFVVTQRRGYESDINDVLEDNIFEVFSTQDKAIEYCKDYLVKWMSDYNMYDEDGRDEYCLHFYVANGEYTYLKYYRKYIVEFNPNPEFIWTSEWMIDDNNGDNIENVDYLGGLFFVDTYTVQ